MKRRTFSQALALGALACASPALFAQTPEVPANPTLPVMGPDDMRAELNELLPNYRLIGKQRLTYWGFQVYDARLWALPGFKRDNIAGQPFALELAYLRDFDAIDVAERSITEMRRSATISEAQAKTWIAEMMRVYPDFKKGDRVTGINKPGVGAAYMVNGKSTGEIRDVEFVRLFFGIWLSPKTSEPKLRSALLAGAV